MRSRPLQRTLAAALAAGAVLLTAPGAGAIDFEKLVMPGPVAAGHADIEGECRKCHAPFARNTEAALCRSCHEDVDADIRTHEGFHGRLAPGALGSCRSCHPEHRGRNADIVRLDPGTFDHTRTDFALEGAHAAVACAGCHPSGKSAREAPARCVDCHGDSDPHAGALGQDCAGCHVPAAWGETRFDHSSTRFALEGAHAKAPCAACHAGERYEGTPLDCATCHGLDDVHRGQLGPRCGDCHGVASWKKGRFDHDRDTHFPLRASHRKVACKACHTGPSLTSPVPSDCLGCHRTDDVHRGSNGEDCSRCHDAGRWDRPTFSHTRDTKFPLRGRHDEIACRACHDQPPFARSTPTDCVACHERDDAHDGQQGRDCGKCHAPSGWSEKVAFDHDLTRFPLLGLHAAVACEECHADGRYADADPRCASCHRQDDAHEARLGSDCARCHNPNGWPLWRFDHDTETPFALHGAHEEVACESCHRTPARGERVSASASCASCHAFDDIHRGAFGADCSRCHGDQEWRQVHIGR